jgi:hypothetical protein
MRLISIIGHRGRLPFYSGRIEIDEPPPVHIPRPSAGVAPEGMPPNYFLNLINPQRCNGCGGITELPCKLCAALHWMNRKRMCTKPSARNLVHET